MNSLEEDKLSLNNILNAQKNNLSKSHNFEVLALENRINELENQLVSEKI